MLRAFLGKNNSQSSSFLSASALTKIIKGHLQKNGLHDYCPHSLRKGTATSLLEQDIPIEVVQELLGHSDVRTTALYDARNTKVSQNLVERI